MSYSPSEPQARRASRRGLHLTLAALPFVGMLVLVPFVNRDEPYVLGLPFLLFWIVLWVVLTSVCMTVIYHTDPANKPGSDQ